VGPNEPKIAELSDAANQVKVEILDNICWVVQKRFCTMGKDVPVKTIEDTLIPSKSPTVILGPNRTGKTLLCDYISSIRQTCACAAWYPLLNLFLNSQFYILNFSSLQVSVVRCSDSVLGWVLEIFVSNFNRNIFICQPASCQPKPLSHSHQLYRHG